MVFTGLPEPTDVATNITGNLSICKRGGKEEAKMSVHVHGRTNAGPLGPGSLKRRTIEWEWGVQKAMARVEEDRVGV